MYIAIKHIHMLCAVLSIAGFLLRGVWMFMDSQLLQKKLTRILPHIIDTLLLVTALTLVVMSQQYPFQLSWLTAKVIALVVYIALGMVALRFGRNKLEKGLAFFAAIFCFAYIMSVAFQRLVWPF